MSSVPRGDSYVRSWRREAMPLHFWCGKLSDWVVMPLSTGRTYGEGQSYREESSDLDMLNLRCLGCVESCIRPWSSGGRSSLEIETCRQWAF